MPKIDPRDERMLEDPEHDDDVPEHDPRPAPNAAKQQRRRSEKVRGKAIAGFLKDLKKERRSGKP